GGEQHRRDEKQKHHQSLHPRRPLAGAGNWPARTTYLQRCSAVNKTATVLEARRPGSLKWAKAGAYEAKNNPFRSVRCVTSENRPLGQPRKSQARPVSAWLVSDLVEMRAV